MTKPRITVGLMLPFVEHAGGRFIFIILNLSDDAERSPDCASIVHSCHKVIFDSSVFAGSNQSKRNWEQAAKRIEGAGTPIGNVLYRAHTSWMSGHRKLVLNFIFKNKKLAIPFVYILPPSPC